MGAPMGREGERAGGICDGGFIRPAARIQGMGTPNGDFHSTDPGDHGGVPRCRRHDALAERSGYAASLIGSIFGRGLRDARHRSYEACIRSHDSALPPSAAASLRAMSALTAARPLTTRDRATRDTPSFLANSLTVRPDSPSTVSRRTSPG